MPEKPEKEKDFEEKEGESSSEKDREERSYYYDDSHGYEVYESEEDDED